MWSHVATVIAWAGSWSLACSELTNRPCSLSSHPVVIALWTLTTGFGWTGSSRRGRSESALCPIGTWRVARLPQSDDARRIAGTLGLVPP